MRLLSPSPAVLPTSMAWAVLIAPSHATTATTPQPRPQLHDTSLGASVATPLSSPLSAGLPPMLVPRRSPDRPSGSCARLVLRSRPTPAVCRRGLRTLQTRVVTLLVKPKPKSKPRPMKADIEGLEGLTHPIFVVVGSEALLVDSHTEVESPVT